MFHFHLSAHLRLWDEFSEILSPKNEVICLSMGGKHLHSAGRVSHGPAVSTCPGNALETLSTSPNLDILNQNLLDA